MSDPDPKTLVLTPIPRIPLGSGVDSGQSPAAQNQQQPSPQNPITLHTRRAIPAIDDAAEAEALMQKGWLLRPVSEDEAASKSLRRALSRRRRQRAGEQQLWWCGSEVIDSAAQAEALTKQGWLLRPISEWDDEEESNDEKERSADDGPNAQGEPADGRSYWRFGVIVIKDPARAEDLIRQGWLLQTADGHNGEQDRGRSLKIKRCVSTDVDGGLGAAREYEGAHEDGAPGPKRQRLT
ncbi:hypothetical protein F5883DRAFT_653418 [Diaporthe sp. PMI_573]|nr:hypothetical protein F5883DRAFT_653418 [Diaporthaceae sp. PMI_573]